MRSYIAGLLTGSPAYWDVDGSKVYMQAAQSVFQEAEDGF